MFPNMSYGRSWLGNSFSCHNLSSGGSISTILWFSESLESYLSSGVHIWKITEFANFGQIPWIIYSPWSKAEKWQIMVRIKLGIFNTPFERSLSKLSENHKIIEFGSMILKLWLFNYTPPPLHLINDGYIGSSFSHHNLSSGGSISPILWFYESLEKYL